jgi:hypothetical protein
MTDLTKLVAQCFLGGIAIEELVHDRHVISVATGARLAARRGGTMSARGPLSSLVLGHAGTRTKKISDSFTSPLVARSKGCTRPPVVTFALRYELRLKSLSSPIQFVLTHLGHGTYHNHNLFLCYL